MKKYLMVAVMSTCVLSVTAISVGCSSDRVISQDTLSQLKDEKSRQSIEQSEVSGAADVTIEAASTPEGMSAADDVGNVSDDTEYIWVYVCGAVKNPGVFMLESGSRAVDALELAGGFGDDADEEYVNLAKALVDGERLYFPTVGEYEGTGEERFPEDFTEDVGQENVYPININTADEDKLCMIPGIGPTKASAIVAYRDKYGKFESTEDIMNVTGIGEGTYSKIREYICV